MDHQPTISGLGNSVSSEQIVYLSLGSNMGDRMLNIREALELLDEQAGHVVSVSSFFETAAWGKTDQPSFYNVAAALQTGLSPLDLLDKILEIEQQIGRVRLEKWGPRLIDIDILLYGDTVLTVEDRLVIPHPQLRNRKFVLVPLEEIAANVVDPVSRLTISGLVSELEDTLEVTRVDG